MRKIVSAVIAVVAMASIVPVRAQVKMTREQIQFYTSDWKGNALPMGVPRFRMTC